MNDLSLYFFNNQYYDKVVSDAIYELKNKLYFRSLETQKNVTNMVNYKIPFNEFNIRGNLNTRMKLPGKSYSYIIDKNLLPYYNKKIFLSKYGYEKPISLKQLYLDYEVFNQRIICNIDSKFITDLYFVALPSDETLIYFHGWSAADINSLQQHVLNLSFEYSGDYYYTRRNKTDLIQNNRILVSTFTNKVKLPKLAKMDAYKVYIGNSETNLRAVNGKGVIEGGILYIELPVDFVTDLPITSLHCYIMNEDKKLGSIRFSKREDNDLIFQIDFDKNIISLENIKIYEINETQRILKLLHPTIATILYPNVYDFRNMNLENDKKYLIEWYESSDKDTSVTFDNNIKDYLLYKGISYSDGMINLTLPRPLLDYNPIKSFEYNSDDYKNHSDYGDIVKYRISKLGELLKDNSNRSNNIVNLIDERNKRYIHLSTNGNIDPAIMSRTIMDNSIHADGSEIISFNEPHTYIIFSNSYNGNRATQLFLDGYRTVPTHIYTSNYITYVYIPKSKIYKNTEIIIDMAISLASALDNKKVVNMIFRNIYKPSKLPIASDFGRVSSHDLLFFDALTNNYIPREIISFGMFVDKYFDDRRYLVTNLDEFYKTINLQKIITKKENVFTPVPFVPILDDIKYLVTNLDEFYKTVDLQKILLNKETVFVPAPDEGFYKLVDSRDLTVSINNISFANTEISITNTDNYRWAKLKDAKIGDIIKLANFREDTDPRRIKVFYGGIVLDESNYLYKAPLKYDGDATIEIISLPPRTDRTIIVEYLPYIEYNIFKGNSSSVHMGNGLIDLSNHHDRELNLDYTKIYINGYRIASTRIRKYNANNVFRIMGLGDGMDLRVDVLAHDPSPYSYQDDNFLINKLLSVDSGFIEFMANKNIKSVQLSDNSLSKIKMLNGRYFIVGKKGTILTSNDKINWFECVTNSNMGINDIEFAKGKYIAVGDGGTILSSDNGNVWSKYDLDIDNSLVGVSYLNGVFLIVGKSEVLLKSTDGITWYPLSFPAVIGEVELVEILAGESKFIIYGNTNKIFLTTDGIEWEIINTVNNVSSLTENDNGVIIYSQNSGKVSKIIGTNEFMLIPNELGTINSINYSKGLFIVSLDNKIIIIMEDNSLNRQTTNTNYYTIDINSYKPQSSLLIDNDIVIIDSNGYIHYIPFYHNIKR